jgi:hypothetical protein
MPSELLHGEAVTNSGMVNGNFFNPSKLLPKAYRLPSFGSGRNALLKTKKKETIACEMDKMNECRWMCF